MSGSTGRVPESLGLAQAKPDRLSPRVRATASGRPAGVSSQPHGNRHGGRRSRRPANPAPAV